MKKGLSLLLVCSMLLCILTACSDGDGDATTTTPTQTTTVSTVNGKYFNPLTGEYTLGEGEGNRPVGIMVPNESAVRGGQAGLDKADFYMESEAEGSIPRLMAVFANASRIPDKFGPIRSARSHYINTARALGALYIHYGGSGPAKTLLSQNVIEHIDGIASGSTTWRDNVLTSKNGSVNNVAISAKNVIARMEKQGYSNTLDKTLPFTFGEKVGDITAANVELRATPGTTSSFVYDSATGLYTKKCGKLANATTHKSLEGNAIKVSNVLVLYAEKYVDDQYKGYTIYNFRNGEGDGYIVSNGTARKIKFNRTDTSLTFTELDGTPVVFATGKTYMHLIDKDLSDQISFS